MSEKDLAEIFQKAKTNDQELYQLLQHGRQHGFDSFLNRKLIWPFLLDIQFDPLGDSGISDWIEAMDHNSIDYEQLVKDAERSLASMKTFQNITKFHLKNKQKSVLKVLQSFFARNKDLRYIQGFHDVASIFLIMYGEKTGFCMMQKTGRIYFHDFLKYQFGQLSEIISTLIFDLVIKKDKQFKIILGAYQERKFLNFILPWILTWFSHVFSSIKVICRIWDYILCTGPYGIIYLSAGMILSTKRQLINKLKDQFDQASVQCFYQQQVKNQAIDIKQSIQIALTLQQQFPIDREPIVQKFNDNSVYRLNFFYNLLPKIKKFHQILKKKRQTRKILVRTAIAFGTVLLATGAIYIAYKSGKLGVLWKKGQQL